MNQNIERKNYESATKEEKARHNGVDTSRWGNNCPRIAVPEGFEDHQYTQQLVRLYLNNDNSFYIFNGNKVLVFLTEKEWIPAVINTDEGELRIYRRVAMTFCGLCLNFHIRKSYLDEVPEEGYIDPGDGRVNFGMIKEMAFYECSDDRKKIILGKTQIDRQEFINQCIKSKDIRFTEARWLEYKKNIKAIANCQ